jgi:hypothetical protein
MPDSSGWRLCAPLSAVLIVLLGAHALIAPMVAARRETGRMPVTMP